MEKKVTFTNWTNEDFSHAWGGEIITIPAYSFIELEAGIADVFAYHLAVRELNKENKDIGCFINEYKPKALVGITEKPVVETEIVEDTDEQTTVVEETTTEEKVLVVDHGNYADDDTFEGLKG